MAETIRKPIGTKLSHHNFEISRNNVGHLDKVCWIVRQRQSRLEGDEMLDVEVNGMICQQL